jgi:WD40 repeat protein
VLAATAAAAIILLAVLGYRMWWPADSAGQSSAIDPLPGWKPPTVEELAARPSPLDGRKWAAPAGSFPETAEIVAVLGESRFRLPKAALNSWLTQDRDGKFLAASNGDTVAVFDAKSGQLIRTLIGTDRIYNVAISPDGEHLAAGNWQGEWDKVRSSTIQVWNLQTGRAVARFTSGVGWTYGLAFSPDGKHLLNSGNTGVEVREFAGGKRLHSLAGGNVWQLGLSSDGSKVAHYDLQLQSVVVFNPITGERIGALSGFTDIVRSTAFSPDGKILATGNDKELLIWDAEKLELIRRLDTPSGWMAFEPGGKTLLTAGADQHGAKRTQVVTRWDLQTFQGQPLESLSDKEGWTSFHLSPDGKKLFFNIAEEPKKNRGGPFIDVFDPATGKRLIHRQGHSGELWAVAASPDGRTIASGGADGAILIWDLAGWKAGELQPPGRRVNGHTDAVFSLAFSRDGRLLASGSKDGTIRLWDAAAGTELRALQAETSKNTSDVAFSADGKLVAAGDEDGSVRLWDVESGEERSPLRWHDQL